jgi:hypothetical protein
MSNRSLAAMSRDLVAASASAPIARVIQEFCFSEGAAAPS